jgi:dTDP-L-rhamnose 4-epimerase
MKTILVTGGAGFIGSHLCEKLVGEGNRVFVMDNLLQQVHGVNPDLNSETFAKVRSICTIIIGDANLESTWEPLIDIDFDAIVCLAAETGTGQSMMRAQSYCSTNIGTIALLNDLVVNGKIKTKRVVLSSSRSVYGDAILDEKGNPIATKEGDETNPQSIYAVTKLCQEQILFSGFRGVEVSALRFQNVYGPGQSLKNPYTGILSIFSVAMKSGKDVQLFGDGMMSRDFVYVDDVVDSLLLAINGQTKDREIYNVGSGQRTTVLTVAETLKRLYSSNTSIYITGEELKGDIRHNFADITKIQQLGYQPKVFFTDGVARFVSWVEQHTSLAYNDYEKSITELRNTGILK